MLTNAKRYRFIPFFIITLFLNACTALPAVSSPSSSLPDKASDMPAPVLPSRLEVFYFYPPFRCATCMCYEERIDNVVNMYFKNELKSGKLVFKIIEIGDRKTAALTNKFDAYASQLFINTVVDNVDNIKNVTEIYFWNCVNDESGFNSRLKLVIEQSLERVK